MTLRIGALDPEQQREREREPTLEHDAARIEEIRVGPEVLWDLLRRVVWWPLPGPAQRFSFPCW